MYDGQKLLLMVVIFKQSNSNFSINKYKDAVDQFDSQSDRLTWSVADRPLINCDFLPRHLFLCSNSCMQSVIAVSYTHLTLPTNREV